MWSGRIISMRGTLVLTPGLCPLYPELVPSPINIPTNTPARCRARPSSTLRVTRFITQVKVSVPLLCQHHWKMKNLIWLSLDPLRPRDNCCSSFLIFNVRYNYSHKLFWMFSETDQLHFPSGSLIVRSVFWSGLSPLAVLVKSRMGLTPWQIFTKSFLAQETRVFSHLSFFKWP